MAGIFKDNINEPGLAGQFIKDSTGVDVGALAQPKADITAPGLGGELVNKHMLEPLRSATQRESHPANVAVDTNIDFVAIPVQHYEELLKAAQAKRPPEPLAVQEQSWSDRVADEALAQSIAR